MACSLLQQKQLRPVAHTHASFTTSCRTVLLVLHKRSSFPSWCKLALSKFITLHFFHPLKGNTLSSFKAESTKTAREADKRRKKEEDFLEIPNSRQEITNGKA